jgi:hypothetical protein
MKHALTATQPAPPVAAYALLLVFFFLGPIAAAGGHPEYGGHLDVATVGATPFEGARFSDTPVDAAMLRLTHTPLCKAADVQRVDATTFKLVPLAPATAQDINKLLRELRASNSVYAALLASVSDWRVENGLVVISLLSPGFPFEKVLCHPALSLNMGPFVKSANSFRGSPVTPQGRPFIDLIDVASLDSRSAERMTKRQSLVSLGAGADQSGPQLFVLALSWHKDFSARFKTALEASVVRGDLTRFFLKSPVQPLSGLFPFETKEAASQASLSPSKPPPLSVPVDITLVFEASERAVAERLQLKLQPFGYRVLLKTLPRVQMKQNRPGPREVFIDSFLLPPSAAAAVPLWLALTQNKTALLNYFSALGTDEHEAKAREWIQHNQSALSLFPLAIRGLAIGVSRDVTELKRDDYGLPRFDDALLVPSGESL